MKGNKIKNQILLNIFVIIAAVVFVAVLILGNVGRVAANVAVVPGSYGEKYASENKLNVVALSDNEKGYFDQRYESFDYNISGSEIVLESYKGHSTDLVVPASIDGKDVTTLGEGFINSLESVKHLYIPYTVTEIKGEPDQSIIICCYEDSVIYKDYLKAQEDGAEKTWNCEAVYDSDFINFYLGDNPFAYNVNGGTVEIARYNGSDSTVVIPSYIDGNPVTKISMNLLGKPDLIVIPETISEITGTSAKLLYSPIFAIELFFSIVAIVLSLLSVNILLPRYRKSTSEYLLTGSQMVTNILYVVCQLGFAIAAIYYIEISAFLALVVSLVILGVYVFLMFSSGIGRQHAKEVSGKIAEKTSRMKAIKESVKGLDEGITDPEVKKQVRRLVEEIRYSDPVTNDDLDFAESEIETAVYELKKIIDNGDSDAIIEKTNNAMDLVKKRNKMCKAYK